MNIIGFVKNWTLPVAMLTGVLAYFAYAAIPALDGTHAFASQLVGYLQPLLLFCMLFIAFCKVRPSELRPQWWHLWLALIQLGLFSALAAFLWQFPASPSRLVIEGAMLALVCPTATAASVVTLKLGGSAAAITSYTLFINLAVAVVAPLMLPLAHPQAGISFWPAFLSIIGKVFPLLMFPLLMAWLVRYTLPRFHQVCLQTKDLAFYLWAIALALAIAVTCKALAHSHESWVHVGGIALATLVCCLFQFAVGKWIGGKYGYRIEGGQSLGQKNTVFVIWLGYTFLSPISAVAGGFYSVWHNVINSYQLYKKRKSDESDVK